MTQLKLIGAVLVTVKGAAKPVRALISGVTREELLKDLPRVAAFLDMDVQDLKPDTLVVSNLRRFIWPS